MNKNELIAMVESRCNQIETILAEKTSAELEREIRDNWSFKDTLAHIAFWDGELLDFYELVLRGASISPQLEDDDTINARVYEANHNRSLEAVATDFRQVYQRLIERLKQTSQEQLDNSSPVVENWTLASHIISNMDHVVEHLTPVAVLYV